MNAEAKQPEPDYVSLVERIKSWGLELGFQQIGIADLELGEHEQHLLQWLNAGWHGEMGYMARHGAKRARPTELVPGTLRVISGRMDYLPEPREALGDAIGDPARAFISRYALGRDYHKVLRGRLGKLARRIQEAIGPFGYRVFVDSAPVLEKALAERAGLGWIGKHTCLINRFFLNDTATTEIYTDLPLPPDQPVRNHCGSCSSCIAVCPTGAIVAPYQLDARRCISYLTIELRGSIPSEFREAIGNRIYGCDDCQLVCPWNRYGQLSSEPDFQPRHGLEAEELMRVFAWDEAAFLAATEGSAIRRIGYECWLRNVAVALGNAPPSTAVIGALAARRDHPSALVREHVAWALSQLQQRRSVTPD
jgi:epoxyqueuosine reductase